MNATRRGVESVLAGLAGLLGVGLAMILPAGCGGDCDGKTYYGPPPCQTDQECIDAKGANWYCDKEHVIDPACDTKWPTCVQR